MNERLNLLNTEALYEALKAKIMLDAHPIGSYYWSSEEISPSVLFGGQWEQVKDRFILAAGPVGDVGGDAEHILPIDEMPAHSHSSRGVNPGASTSSAMGSYPFQTGLYQTL